MLLVGSVSCRSSILSSAGGHGGTSSPVRGNLIAGGGPLSSRLRGACQVRGAGATPSPWCSKMHRGLASSLVVWGSRSTAKQPRFSVAGTLRGGTASPLTVPQSTSILDRGIHVVGPSSLEVLNSGESTDVLWGLHSQGHSSRPPWLGGGAILPGECSPPPVGLV